MSEQLAITRWIVQDHVFLFYGNGGLFAGEAFEAWLTALQTTPGLSLYIGGAGGQFRFDAVARARGTEYFKRAQLRFAAISDDTMHRILGSTARLVGMDLGLYAWKESRRPFEGLKTSHQRIEALHNRFLQLRSEVDSELGVRTQLLVAPEQESDRPR
jgi:hypothetical protein